MSTSDVEFRILGPLEVRVGGASVAIGGPRLRALLALLLLDANRVVSRDRLVAELAGGDPHGSGAGALKVQISRLRALLAEADVGDGRVVSRPPGYQLRVEAGELDLDVFERLLDAARRARQGDNPQTAAALLREAESLWHGRALADLEFEPFARIEAERLEELRLTALEERIDAELALGRHSQLVPELDALVATHPLREQLRSQQMLALYRAGRQPEALEAYRAGRVLLVQQLALEPGPRLKELQQAILRQEPSLNLLPVSEQTRPTFALVAAQREGTDTRERSARPPQPVTMPVQVKYRLRWPLLAAGVAAGVVLLAAAASTRGGHAAPAVVAVRSKSVAVIDPATQRVVRDIRVPTQPESLVAGAGKLWVGGAADTLTPIEPGGRVGAPIPIGVDPVWLAFGQGAVWAYDGLQYLSEADARTESAVGNPVRVWRCASTYHQFTHTNLDRCGGGGIAVVGNEVWVSTATDFNQGPVLRLTATGGDPQRTGRTSVVAAGPMALGEGGVWTAGLYEVDYVNSPSHLVTRIPLPPGSANGLVPGSLTVASGYAWYAPPAGGLYRCSDTSQSCTLFQIAPAPTGITATTNALWVSTASGHVFEYSSPTVKPIRAYNLGRTSATAITYADGKIWVALAYR